jgi:23S rRNA (uracil1939-C5)-methyltransferase
MQANLDAFEKGIIPTVAKYVPENCTVAELYSGIGVLGLNVAHKSKEVFCSDSNGFVDEIFDNCADSLAEEDRDKVFYENLAAEDAIEAGQCEIADCLIVDPPRKGLDAGVKQLLMGTHESQAAPDLKRLIYVSCGFDALERDTRELLESGKWKLKAAEGFVLFPGSDHVETVVVMDRTSKPIEPAIAKESDSTPSSRYRG